MIENKIIERSDFQNNGIEASYRITSEFGLDDFLLTAFHLLYHLISRVENYLCWNDIRKSSQQFNWYKLFVSKGSITEFGIYYYSEDRKKDKEINERNFEADFITSFSDSNKNRKYYKKLANLYVKWRIDYTISKYDLDIIKNTYNFKLDPQKLICKYV